MKQSRNTELAHEELKRRKRDRLDMLRALIFSWERQEGKKNTEYIKELYRKADRLQNQINVMAL